MFAAYGKRNSPDKKQDLCRNDLLPIINATECLKTVGGDRFTSINPQNQLAILGFLFNLHSAWTPRVRMFIWGWEKSLNQQPNL